MRFLFYFLCGILPVMAWSQPPLRVASLSTVLTDVARSVGGESVEVVEIVGPGVDPHHFEPTPGDMRRMVEADLVLANGLGFESFLGRLQSGLKPGQLLVVGDAIKNPIITEGGHSCDEDHDHGHSHSHSHAGPDPHWWHSIANMKTATQEIKQAFIRLRPEDKAKFETGAKAYNRQLDELSKWVRVQLAPIPRRERVLVTSHDALAYFARDYQFTILPVQGVTTADQPSSKKVRDLIDTIRSSGIKTVFAENIENPRVLQEITRETGVTLGGTLYSDGLGSGETATYDGMMRHNVSTIVTALQN